GGAIVVFSVVIPPALGLTMEMTVALMLVVLGLWNLTGLIQTVRDQLGGSTAPHAHAHRHGDYVHSHRHGHGPQDHGHAGERTPQAWLDRRLGGLGVYPIVRPLGAVLVRGLAGSAAVAVPVLPHIGHPARAMAFPLPFRYGA